VNPLDRTPDSKKKGGGGSEQRERGKDLVGEVASRLGGILRTGKSQQERKAKDRGHASNQGGKEGDEGCVRGEVPGWSEFWRTYLLPPRVTLERRKRTRVERGGKIRGG